MAGAKSNPGLQTAGFASPLNPCIVRRTRMTAFQEYWVRIAERFGLKVQIPFQVELANARLTVPVLLEEFGTQRGMLLVTS